MENYKASSELPPGPAQQIDEPEICSEEEYEKPKISSERTVKATLKLPVFSRRNASKAGRKRFSSTQKANRKLTRKREIYRETLNNSKDTMLLVAALIATFTYNAGINPPGGVHQSGSLIGTCVAARRAAFKAFTVFNNLALFLALYVVFLLVGIMVPLKRKRLRNTLWFAYLFIFSAITSMSIGYVAAIMVIMKPGPGQKGLDWTTALLLAVCGYLLVAGLGGPCTEILNYLRRKVTKTMLSRDQKTAQRELEMVEASSDCDDTPANSEQEYHSC